MLDRLDPIDRRLLDEFQRDFPLVPRPFAVLADRLGLTETAVIDRLARHRAEGRISRVGATVRPNTAGASTLAAMQVSQDRIEEVAAIVGALPGVNHSYLREHDWNLWFVATAPDAAALEAELDHLRAATGLTVLDLRLVRPFNIDLGFALSGPRRAARSRASADLTALQGTDRPLLHALSQGLALCPQPWAALAETLGWSETQVLERSAALARAGILTRIGIIVRHRAVGWTANAMVVWDATPGQIDTAGPALAALPGVTLCYQRVTVPGLWPYALFSMIHARTRPEALEVLERARALAPLKDTPHAVLFSTRCFKQQGARLAHGTGKAA